MVLSYIFKNYYLITNRILLGKIYVYYIDIKAKLAHYNIIATMQCFNLKNNWQEVDIDYEMD